MFGVDVKDIIATRYQRSYLYDIVLPNLVGIGSLSLSSIYDTVSSARQVITSVASLKLIKNCIEDIKCAGQSLREDTYERGPFKSVFAGEMDKATLTITLRETEDGLVGEYFRAWRNLIIDKYGVYGIVGQYAKPMNITFYRKDTQVGKQFVLDNCFPLDIESFSLSYGRSDIIRYEVKIAVNQLLTSIDALI